MKAHRSVQLVLAAAALLTAFSGAVAHPASGDSAPAAKVERLSEPRARAAVKAKGERRAGRPVTVSLLERLSRSQFFGTAEWVRTATRQGREVAERCFALMEVKLNAKARVHTALIETGCKRIPPQLPEAEF